MLPFDDSFGESTPIVAATDTGTLFPFLAFGLNVFFGFAATGCEDAAAAATFSARAAALFATPACNAFDLCDFFFCDFAAAGDCGFGFVRPTFPPTFRLACACGW